MIDCVDKTQYSVSNVKLSIVDNTETSNHQDAAACTASKNEVQFNGILVYSASLMNTAPMPRPSIS